MRGITALSRVFGAALVVGGIGSVANAAVVVGVPVDDQFEYANQAAFEASWPAIGTVAPLSGELSTAQAKSPIKSIRNPGTATNNQSRNQKTFAETGTVAVGEQIVWSFDFYDAQSPLGNPQRNYSNLQDGTGPAADPPSQLISMGLNNNQLGADSGGQFYMARILGFAHSAVDPDGGPNEAAGGTGSGGYFKLNDTGVGLRTVGWHNLKVVITTDGVGAGQDFFFYVDNVLAETVLNAGDGIGSGLRSYDVIRMGSGLGNGNTEVFFDNMQLQVLPEPTSLAAIGLGALALGIRRRRA